MTGFGTAEGAVGSSRVTVEVRSVNHRFFNPSIKLPAALSRWEAEVREVLRKVVSRGHVTLMARIDRAPVDDTAAIHEERFGEYVRRLRALQERHQLEGPIDLGTVLRMPDVIATQSAEEDGTAAELVAIVENAGAALSVSRESEGKRLAGFLVERLQLIADAVDRLAERAPRRVVEHHERMKASVAELMQGLQLDEQRLAQEVALLADRLDVGEELDRFRSHLTAFREAVTGNGTDAIGKKLGFLLQELLREANTTGSKANDVVMTREVMAIKEELERIREQVENLE